VLLPRLAAEQKVPLLLRICLTSPPALLPSLVLPGRRLRPLFAISLGDILLEAVSLAPLHAQCRQRPARQQVWWKKGPIFGKKSMQRLCLTPNQFIFQVSKASPQCGFQQELDHSLVPYLLPLLKCKCLKLNLVVGQCKGVQHFSTDFWPGTFSESLSCRKGKVIRDG